MDCCELGRNESSVVPEIFPNVSSPEMFNSDVEDEKEDKNVSSATEETVSTVNTEKPSQAELVAKSDSYLLARINKYLSGVPPPPKHTICQSDCSELLLHIQQNPDLFWKGCSVLERKDSEEGAVGRADDQSIFEPNDNCFQRTKNGSRNLTDAFNACDFSNNQFDNGLNVKCDSSNSNSLGTDVSVCSTGQSTVESTKNESESSAVLTSVQAQQHISDIGKTETLNTLQEDYFLRYHTIDEKTAATLTWPEAYCHKFHGIHYNRSKTVEEFENLTVKLCERYIGAETQSTCNVFFSKQAPGSARKRSLLAKRNNGQSPGKRLSHLTKRRRTFSSANLQGLGLTDRKQLVLNVKKPVSRKGKSPRGKSPRGKSPRSSAKKKVARRLALEGPSPRKSKLETSKRALFQSPPADRAGPSKSLTGVNPQRIKRALFPTPKKKETEAENMAKVTTEESRKRKNEEEPEGPRLKWPKSLSFDCPHELENTKSMSSWNHERHSSSTIVSKTETSFTHGKSELSDTHRKKLLWAVAEALRSKGIGMDHPQFKQYASNLARTIKKFMPDLENKNIPRKPGSTSDRMLKLAKHHVLFMIEARPPTD